MKLNKAERAVLRTIQELNEKSGSINQSDIEITYFAQKKHVNYKDSLKALDTLHKKGKILMVERYWQIPGITEKPDLKAGKQHGKK